MDMYICEEPLGFIFRKTTMVAFALQPCGVTVAQLLGHWCPDQKVEGSIPDGSSGVSIGKLISSTLPHHEKLIY